MSTQRSPAPTNLSGYFRRLIADYLAYFIPSDARVLDVGARNRALADRVPPGQYAVFEPASAAFRPDERADTLARIQSFDPDRIVLNGTLHSDADIQQRLEFIQTFADTRARLLITYYNSLWRPLFTLADRLGLRDGATSVNWIAPSDVSNLLRLSGFELVTTQPRVLIPVWIPVISWLVNRWLAPLPVLRWFSWVHVAVARPATQAWTTPPSVSVVVPARNEAGNIARIVETLPQLGPDDELIFVEGHSTDDTWSTVLDVARRYPERRITCLQQTGRGKGDAVRAGFAIATRDILMILDADLTVPAGELTKFYRARVSGAGEFINGSRLVYTMEQKAMNFLNLIGNKFFALAFSFLLGQSFKDTLCGTKVIDRVTYERLARERGYFGEFDPFGDFDLLFGAQRLGLRICELPIRYRERVYGETNIQRWRHGWQLLRMTVFAARRVLFI